MVSVTALRRYVVAHQGYASRFRRARHRRRRRRDRAAQRGAARLDLHRRPRAPASRSPRASAPSTRPTSRALLAPGRSFEYWAHEACLLPIEDYALFKRRMVELRRPPLVGPASARRRGAKLERARARRGSASEGALPVRAFEGRSGPMWGWKPEKRALEHLFAAGELAIAGRQGFQRVYDLPERVIPDATRRARRRRRTSSGAGTRCARCRGAARSPSRASPSTAASRAA